jgi:hypothetical protein
MAQGVRVLSLFLNVAFHASAERGIKLGEIADLHGWVVASQLPVSVRGAECFGLMQIGTDCVPGTGECNCFQTVTVGETTALAGLFQIREIALGFDGCGTSLTGRGNGLAIDRVGHVSSGKDSR